MGFLVASGGRIQGICQALKKIARTDLVVNRRLKFDTVGAKPFAFIENRRMDFNIIAPRPKGALFVKMPVGRLVAVFSVQHAP